MQEFSLSAHTDLDSLVLSRFLYRIAQTCFYMGQTCASSRENFTLAQDLCTKGGSHPMGKTEYSYYILVPKNLKILIFHISS